MIRVSAATVLVLASLASAACADNLLKERPAAKVVKSTTPKAAFAVQGSAKGASSVCASYRRQLRVVQLRLAATPNKATNDQLKAKELSLNAVIADACE
jgi:hypothetical protein